MAADRLIRPLFTLLCASLVLFGLGCRSTVSPDVRRSGSLPFVVAIEGREGDEHGLSMIRLHEDFIASEAFTYVTTPSDGIVPDVVITLGVSGESFGEFTVDTLGASLSTTTWLFLGYVGWFFADHVYMDSNYFAEISAAVPESKHRLDFYRDTVSLNAFELSRFDRVPEENRSWDVLAGVFIPPFAPMSISTEALWRQSEERLVVDGIGRMVRGFPLGYLEQHGCYVVYRPDQDDLILVAREMPFAVTLTAKETGSKRTLDLEAITTRELRDPETEESVRRDLSERGLGIGGTPLDRLYLIPLTDRELGFVRIAIELQTSRGDFTIERPLE